MRESLGVRVRDRDGSESGICMLMIVLPLQATRGPLFETGPPNGELILKVSLRNRLRVKLNEGPRVG